MQGKEGAGRSTLKTPGFIVLHEWKSCTHNPLCSVLAYAGQSKQSPRPTSCSAHHTLLWLSSTGFRGHYTRTPSTLGQHFLTAFCTLKISVRPLSQENTREGKGIITWVLLQSHGPRGRYQRACSSHHGNHWWEGHLSTLESRGGLALG